MFKKILIKLNKYKLLIILLVIIVLLVIIKLNSKQKINTSDIVDQKNSEKSNDVMKVNEVKITPTEIIDLKNKEEITPTKTGEEFISINDYAFPYEDSTFLAQKYDNGKVYAKTKIDDRAKAERDLKYWYFNEIGDTLPSSNIVWQ